MASTDAALIAYYAQITRILYTTVSPVVVIIGSIGAILGCIVFSQKTMRQQSASIYFIAFNTFNFILLLLVLLPLVVQYSINYRLTIYSVPYCKIYLYCSNVCPALSRYCLVLASIDRALVTSSDALMRRRSTRRLAYRMIIGMALIVTLFYTHLLVGVSIYQSSGVPVCAGQPNTPYSYFNVYSNIVVNSIIPFILLIAFGLQTLRNIRRVRIQPANIVLPAMNSQQFRDRQLTILILVEIAVYIFCSMWVISINIYIQSTQSINKSTVQRTLEQVIQAGFSICNFISPAVNFYQNLIVSKAFRRKATEVFFSRCQQRPIHGSSQHRAGTTGGNRSNLQ